MKNNAMKGAVTNVDADARLYCLFPQQDGDRNEYYETFDNNNTYLHPWL